ncbi:cyclic 3',5'-adenosine monophosphate phosphodiesterase [bacterium BMS3Abin05]|nr:cyclic 3',5'-adenosine monophosphate phosphodiesterase [bacterium BMS3Abin05]GBE26465.1 cyclic 3',5'-adenosine monophosphate phosphodiesterase [bacterium BMS3Bbin03]
MTEKIFNKYLAATASLLFFFAIGMKVYLILTFPKIMDWNYYQLKKIDPAKDEFTFVVFGDNKNSTKTFDNLIKKVNKEDPLFAIDVGDLVFDGQKDRYRLFLKQIKNSTNPLLTVIGNHEIMDNGRGNYYDIFGRFYYAFSAGESYFIILDDANEKNLDPWQFAWLKKNLQIGQNYKHRFVFMHVPLYDPRTAEGRTGHSLKNLRFAKRLNDLFDRSRVTMLFTSHIHAYFRGIWGKTPYIITGGAGAELAGDNPNHYFYHYLTVQVSDHGVSYKVIKLNSPDFNMFDRISHDVWMYIYAFFAIHIYGVVLFLSLIYLTAYFLFIKLFASKKSGAS